MSTLPPLGCPGALLPMRSPSVPAPSPSGLALVAVLYRSLLRYFSRCCGLLVRCVRCEYTSNPIPSVLPAVPFYVAMLLSQFSLAIYILFVASYLRMKLHSIILLWQATQMLLTLLFDRFYFLMLALQERKKIMISNSGQPEFKFRHNLVCANNSCWFGCHHEI